MTITNSSTRRTFLRRTAGAAAALWAAPWLANRCAQAEPAAVERGTWQVGCFTRAWGDLDYRAALDGIAAAGFKHAGLMTHKGGLVISLATTPAQVQQIAQEVRQRGLCVPCVYAGEFAAHESLEAGIAGLRKLLDYAAAVGSATLMVAGTAEAALYNRYYKTVAECCDCAAEKKLGIVLKPHGGLNGTGPQCRKAIDKVGRKEFSLWYDPGNIMFYSDGAVDPVKDAASVAGVVSGMCVKDFTMSVTDGKVAKDVFLMPGTGKVDFPGVMAALKKGGLTGGTLVIETLGRGDQPTILAQAKQAREFVERLVG